jgi:hypothetical protein
MHVTGGCHCGALRFEAEVDPKRIVVCHCTDCQAMGGGAFRTLTPVPETGFRMLAGTPAIYLKTAESGRQRAQGFCARCGTHLYATDPPGTESAGGQFYTVRLGAIDQRRELVPTLEMWCRSRLAWLPQLEGTRKLARQ